MRTFSRLGFALWALLLNIFSADQIFFVKNDWTATDLLVSEASSLLERHEQQLPSSKLYIRVSTDPSEKGNVSKKGIKSNAANMLFKKFVVIISLDIENVCTILHEML